MRGAGAACSPATTEPELTPALLPLPGHCSSWLSPTLAGCHCAITARPSLYPSHRHCQAPPAQLGTLRSHRRSHLFKLGLLHSLHHQAAAAGCLLANPDPPCTLHSRKKARGCCTVGGGQSLPAGSPPARGWHVGGLPPSPTPQSRAGAREHGSCVTACGELSTVSPTKWNAQHAACWRPGRST